MKYLVVNEPVNNNKSYLGITIFGAIQEGVIFDSSFVLHLGDNLVCEISSELYEDVLNKFLSNDMFVDVTEYISQEKAVMVNLNSVWDDDEDFDEDFDEDGE